MSIRFVYQVHKWLAVIVVIATVGWFASGALMALPARWLTLSPRVATGPDAEASLPGAPEFESATISPSAAISGVNARVGASVHVVAMRLRRIPGRLVYEVNTGRHGVHLVDASDGTVVRVDQELAEHVVARILGGDVRLGPVTRQSTPERGYAGPLPAYRIPAADGHGTVFYVDIATAQARLTDPVMRLAGSVMGLHGLGFLRSIMPAPVVRAVMFVLAIAGTVMSLAGIVILIAQLRRWWQRPRVPRDLATR